MSATLRLVALGGLGEIGMNCMALEADGRIIVIDCGVTFPDDLPGVDIIHPDFSWLIARREDIAAIVITHGHEDHIGALPYLLQALKAKLFAPPYAKELIERRLEEHPELGDVEIETTKPGQPFEAGPFRIETVRVTHSIVDATALIIETPAGVVVHTGDFKIDPAPPDGEHFDEARLRAAGDAGVRLLLSDSTNAWVPGTTGGEQDARDALDEAIVDAPGRVIVVLFASNGHRLRSLFDIARRCNRRVLLLGRSLHRHFEVLRQTGYLPDPGALLASEKEARDLPRSRLLVLATGTQGEPRAALARLAEDRHPALDLDPGDRAIFSSRIIPGNETRVYETINALIRLGIDVRFKATDPGVHVSGHAHAEEQKTMLSLVRPETFIPVHGTRMHLERHAQLASEAGVRETLVVENGEVVEVTETTLRVVADAPVGRVAVNRGRVVEREVIEERQRLAEYGVAIVVVDVDERGRAERVFVESRGLIAPDDVELEADAERYVAQALDGAGRRAAMDHDAIEARASQAVRRFFKGKLGHKPLSIARVRRSEVAR